jgi:Thioredoxin-like [2Fe-2S] ferredoxin
MDGKRMPEASVWNAERAKEIIAERAGLEGPMLPILHALQEEFGCVSEAAVRLIAEALNLTRAEVHGVVTFYHDFRREPWRFGRDPRRDLVGADRERGGILGNENKRHAARAPSRALEILSRFKRPSGSPSRRAEGDVAQRPRQ